PAPPPTAPLFPYTTLFPSLVGRDAQRRLRRYTAILGWLHTFSPQTLLQTSVYQRTSSDKVLPTTDPVTPLSDASRASLTLGVKRDRKSTRLNSSHRTISYA